MKNYYTYKPPILIFFFICVMGSVIFTACTRDESKNNWDINFDAVPPQQTFSQQKSKAPVQQEVIQTQTEHPKSLPAIHAPFLLKTKWHQHFPFNKALPIIDGQHVVVGCVNIALAQILYYYKYPLQGNGIAHHSWQDQTFTSVLNRRLYWDKMPVTIRPDTANYSIDELAALIRDISMINQTQFGIGPHEQSGAAFDMNRFVSYFGFSDEIQQTNSNNPQFFDIINKELDARRPVLISIQGHPIDHMAIVDGKTNRNGRTLYHINMGWGGQYNRFYDLSQPIVLESLSNEQSIGQTYRFSNHINLYYPIKPCRKKTCTSNNLEKNDQITGNQIKGQFDSKTDQDRYENILLKGITVIQGNRGYANQAFYIHIYDRFHQLLSSHAPKSKITQYDFEPDIYHFTVSLCQNKTQALHCYELESDYADYDIRISTEVMTEDEKIDLFNNSSPPVIQNELTDIILPRNFKKHIIRVDAFHPMGLPVTLSVKTDSNVIRAHMDDHFLIITNESPKNLLPSKIQITAETNGIKTEASFNLMFSAQRVWFGKLIDIPGQFNHQNSQNSHRIILENRCRLTGYNGFMNQAFYIKISDKTGKVIVDATNQPIDQYFDRGIYQLQTALKVEQHQQTHRSKTISTNYYQYQKGLGDQYVIHAYCPNFNYDLDLLFQDNIDSPPVFQTVFQPIILGKNAKGLSIPIAVIDPDGDKIVLSAGSDHPDIEVRIEKNTLKIIPHSPEVKTTAKIMISANANQKQTHAEFSVFVSKINVSIGKNFELKGYFTSQDDRNHHPVILSGDCQITGFNGFNNQAFFNEILDKNMDTVMPASEYTIENYFNGLYFIKTSLKNRSRYYPYIADKSDRYTVKVSCSEADLDDSFIENLLWSMD